MKQNLYELYFGSDQTYNDKSITNDNFNTVFTGILKEAKVNPVKANVFYDDDILKQYSSAISITEKNDATINYIFNEDKYIKEAMKHIDSTYVSHYSSNGQRQPTEMIIDAGHGTGFNVGNIVKYALRYGKKEGHNRKDLLKIIHYAVMQLYVHDKEKLGN